MKDQRKSEIKVGIMVIIGIIIFLWILGWAKNFSITSDQKIVRIKFDNVSGLEVGDYAMVNGVRKGFVEDMKVEDNGVIVKISLDDDVELNSDATFSISMLDLMGGKKIEINTGTSSTPLEYSKLQSGTFSADIATALSMLGDARGDLYSTLNDVKITLNSLNKYLTDAKLNSDIKNSISNLSEITSKLNILIDENRSNLNKLTSNSVELTDEAKQFISSNKENINQSVKDLKNVLQKSDSLLTKINSFADEVLNKQSAIGKVIYDKKFFDNLKSSLDQVNELTRTINEQLQKDGIKVNAHLSIF